MNFESAIVFVRVTSEGANKGDTALLAAARRLAASVAAVCLGSPAEAMHLDGLCDECLVSETFRKRPDALTLAKILKEQARGETLVLLRHDSLGMDIGPGLATALKLPFVTNITEMSSKAPGLTTVRRPEFSGEILAEYDVKTNSGTLFTVMPGAMGDAEPGKPVLTAITTLPNVDAPERMFLEEVVSLTAGINLASARVLVAVGRGMKSAENIATARRLAAALRGEVCCSRAVVDAGWLEKDRQVGISGQSVSPALYLTLGLHGAFQHMVAVQGNPYLIAVNTNPDAPVFQYAAAGAVTDAAVLATLLADALEGL